MAELDFLIGTWKGDGLVGDRPFEAVLVADHRVDGDFLWWHLSTHAGGNTLHEERAVLSFDRKAQVLWGRFFSSGGLVEVGRATMLWGHTGWPEFLFDIEHTENLLQGVRSRHCVRKLFDWEVYLVRQLALPEDDRLRAYHEIHLVRERRTGDRDPVENHAPRPAPPPGGPP